MSGLWNVKWLFTKLIKNSRTALTGKVSGNFQDDINKKYTGISRKTRSNQWNGSIFDLGYTCLCQV